MFSAVDAVLLRPLPFAEPERLVMVGATSPMTRGGSPTRRGGDLSPADYLDYPQQHELRRTRRSFDESGEADRRRNARAGPCSTGVRKFFQRARRERHRRASISARRRYPGQPAQAVVSEPLWDRRYGRAADLVGRTITVSDQLVEVVGIAPAGFQFEEKVDIWLLGDRGVPRFTSIPNLAAESRRSHTYRCWPAAAERVFAGSAGGARRHISQARARVSGDEQGMGYGARSAAVSARWPHAAHAACCCSPLLR